MASVLVFDVDETLLDLRAMDPPFQRIFGDSSVRQQWFSQFLQSAFVGVIVNAYTPFGQVGMAALEMVAQRRGVQLAEPDKQAVREAMVHLPPYPEVRESLEKLHNAGFHMAALTNSTAQVAVNQLENAGLRALFEKILSADAVRRLKPAPEPYHMAAEEMGVSPSQVRLIAAHAW